MIEMAKNAIKTVRKTVRTGSKARSRKLAKSYKAKGTVKTTLEPELGTDYRNLDLTKKDQMKFAKKQASRDYKLKKRALKANKSIMMEKEITKRQVAANAGINAANVVNNAGKSANSLIEGGMTTAKPGRSNETQTQEKSELTWEEIINGQGGF